MKMNKFLFTYNKKSREKELYISDKKINLKNPFNYEMGYTYSNDGEYIKVNVTETSVEIKNDLYSSHPVYLYEDDYNIIVSSLLVDIINNKNTNTSINSSDIYSYFAFTYLPNQDNTLYSNIRQLKYNTKLVFNEKFEEIHENKNIFLKNNDNKLFDSLVKSTVNKLKGLNNIDTSLCLTSGNDSIISLFLLKYLDMNFGTCTYGFSNSKDIIKSRDRHKLLNGNISREEILFDNIKFTDKELEKFSSITGGITSYSNIYLLYFIENMRNRGYKNLIFSDHFETTRKIITLKDIKENYTTPKEIVNKYFINKDLYNKKEKSTLLTIKDPYQFYLYERVSKGHFYKNLITSLYGMKKITLPFDFNFLQNNYSYIKKTGELTYNKILSKLGKDNAEVNVNHNFSINNKIFLLNHLDFFMNVLELEKDSDISEFFNIKKLRNKLSSNTLSSEEEWFALRLLNFLVFKQINKLKLL